MSVLKEHPVKALPFTKQLGFRKTLNERVDAYLRENNIPARDVPAMYVKAGIAFTWWLAVYLLILFGGFPPLVNLALCVVWALSIGAIGFNIMHDANHGGFSANPRMNKFLGLSGEFLGMSSFRWRTKHNVWHHTYTNIAGLDDDIETFGTMRLSPHEPWKPLYQAQHWYFPLVYSFIAFDFFVRDFMMAFTGKSDDYHIYPKMNREETIIFWGGKLFFVLVMVIIPLFFFPWWQVAIGATTVMLFLGLLTGVVFQLAHIMEKADFPEPVGDPLHIENEWAIHEVQTTVNFAPGNRILNWYIGGLNFQIEHHLLPHIAHANYARIAPIVRQTCEEYGIRYTSYPTWRAAFMSHWRELRMLGRRTQMAGAAKPAR